MHQARHDADSYQRVEVITGLRRRRDWSDAEKARILAESADPEVNISEVARRNGVSRGLLNVWRRKARHASGELPQFVQVKLDDGVEARPDAMSQTRVLTSPAERIEIVIAGATVRVPTGVDGPAGHDRAGPPDRLPAGHPFGAGTWHHRGRMGSSHGSRPELTRSRRIRRSRPPGTVEFARCALRQGPERRTTVTEPT